MLVVCFMTIQCPLSYLFSSLPGRLELMAYMPPNTQAALVQPVGGSAVAVVGGTRQRGFTRLEQAWLASLADKLERVLEREGAVGGAGFGSSCGKKK